MDNWEKCKGDSFYAVDETEIKTAEAELGFRFPEELRTFYLEEGYGFIRSDYDNINRIMDPLSVKDFRLRKNEYEFYPEIDIFDDYEDGKCVFFEMNETVLFSIEVSDDKKNKVFLYDREVASSLTEFLVKLRENELFYLEY